MLFSSLVVTAVLAMPVGIQATCDFNNDGIVDGGDSGDLLSNWGKVTSANAIYDVNRDGLVNGGDLGVILGEWGLTRHDSGDGRYWAARFPRDSPHGDQFIRYQIDRNKFIDRRID